MGLFNSFDPSPGGEIKTVAKFDRGSYDTWSVRPSLFRPLVSANQIRFPKVNARSKPIVSVIAMDKRRTAQKLLSGFFVAAVISEY